MSDFVPWSPTPANLDAHVVGRAVGAAGIKRLINEATHLLAYCKHPLADVTLPKHTTSPASIVLRFTRNPGVDVLLVAVEVWDADGTATFTVATTISAGTINFMAPGEPGTASPFNGASAAFQPPSDVLRDPYIREVFIDVSQLTVGTTYDLTLTATTNTGAPQGFRGLRAIEIPIGATNVTALPTSEVGVAGSWPSPDNPIDSLSTTSPGGFLRLLKELERARKDNKRQFNLAWWATTAGSPNRTNTAFGAFTFPTLTNAPRFKMRTRRIFETTTAMPHEGAWRYWVTGGGTAELRLKIDGNVVGTWTGLTSATPAWTVFKGFDVPCDTANQFVRLSLEGKSTAGTLYIPNFYGREKFS